MLKVGLTPKSAGSSSVYALSFIVSNTLKGPSARGISFDLRKLGNLFLRKCNQTRSPGVNTTCFRPLSPASLYLAFIRSMFSLVNSCIFKINSAHCLASKLTFSKDGRGNKSIGARGRKPYTILKGHILVVECSERL